MSSSHLARQHDHLFSYTSGRWLWNEKQQLDDRYRRFDVSNLRQVACQAAGSAGCVSLEKVGEGNYNKAYRLVLQDGQNIIAKIPHPNAGPSAYTTASEVATMDFARTILHLPVPTVLAWSATDQNPVESEYIIMEEAKGSQLHDVWPHLPRAKREIIHEIVDVEKKMLSIPLDRYVYIAYLSIQYSSVNTRLDRIGSLYFKSSRIPGYEATTATEVPQEVRDALNSRFCIGPVAKREFWEKERRNMHRHHGPCMSFNSRA
jgi:hypothetical protein